MRATTLLLSAALTLCSTTAFAQSSYNRVVEPVGQTVDVIINAPIEYDENGVVKAQHFNADNLTAEEYQEILDEAARIRSYRDANGLNFESDYITVDAPTYVAPTTVTTTASGSPSYQIELFAPETSAIEASTPSYSTTTPSYATSAPSYVTTQRAATFHTISKGDTLYNISKRYNTTVPALQAENNMSGTTLSIGQQIRIPGAFIEAASTYSQPVYANTTTSTNGYIANYVIEPTPQLSSPQVYTSVSSEKTYAVLPRDTLYKISRFTCVDVKDIIARNGITNPDALSPGDMLTLPAGHCLAQ